MAAWTNAAVSGGDRGRSVNNVWQPTGGQRLPGFGLAVRLCACRSRRRRPVATSHSAILISTLAKLCEGAPSSWATTCAAGAPAARIDGRNRGRSDALAEAKDFPHRARSCPAAAADDPRFTVLTPRFPSLRGSERALEPEAPPIRVRPHFGTASSPARSAHCLT